MSSGQTGANAINNHRTAVYGGSRKNGNDNILNSDLSLATNVSPTAMAPNVMITHERGSTASIQQRHQYQHAAGASSSGDRLDSSSDSAVSSMGSERISSLSDGEWGEGSDSAQDYHAGKCAVGPYDFGYNQGTPLAFVGAGRVNNTVHPQQRQHQSQPVAQKKHQMFGKRYPTDYHNGYNNQNNIIESTRSSNSTNQRESEHINGLNQGNFHIQKIKCICN